MARVLNGFRAYAPALSRRQPERKFVLYTRGRSGSELLLDLLRSHPDVACDGEILGRAKRSAWLWVRAHAAQAAAAGKGTYGFKILFNDLSAPQDLADPAAFLRRLHHDGYRIVTLERRNLLRHAVSWLQKQEQQSHYRSEAERASYRPVSIEPEAAVAVMYMHEQTVAAEAGIVGDLPHLELTYEDDLEDAASHQRTADRVFAFLGLEPVAASSSLVRSSAPRLADSIANFDAVAALVSRTRFAKFLEE